MPVLGRARLSVEQGNYLKSSDGLLNKFEDRIFLILLKFVYNISLIYLSNRNLFEFKNKRRFHLKKSIKRFSITHINLYLNIKNRLY